MEFMEEFKAADDKAFASASPGRGPAAAAAQQQLAALEKQRRIFEKKKAFVKYFDLRSESSCEAYEDIVTAVMRGKAEIRFERFNLDNSGVTVCWLADDPKRENYKAAEEHIDEETGEPYLIQPAYENPDTVAERSNAATAPGSMELTQRGELESIQDKLQLHMAQQTAQELEGMLGATYTVCSTEEE